MDQVCLINLVKYWVDSERSHLFMNKFPPKNEVVHMHVHLQSFVLMMCFGRTYQHW